MENNISAHNITTNPGGASYRTTERDTVEVPIRSGIGAGETVLIDRDDLERLRALGVKAFYLSEKDGYRYVRGGGSGSSGGQLTVARIILNAGKGEVVHYRNHNRLDLRRENLIMGEGPALRNDSQEAEDWKRHLEERRQGMGE